MATLCLVAQVDVSHYPTFATLAGAGPGVHILTRRLAAGQSGVWAPHSCRGLMAWSVLLLHPADWQGRGLVFESTITGLEGQVGDLKRAVQDKEDALKLASRDLEQAQVC